MNMSRVICNVSKAARATTQVICGAAEATAMGALITVICVYQDTKETGMKGLAKQVLISPFTMVVTTSASVLLIANRDE